MSIKRTTVYFEKPGKVNTEETHRISLDAAKERGIDTVIIASTTGETGLKALKVFKDSGLQLVVVTHQTGWSAPGVQLMPKETRKILEKAGVTVVTCTDALAGGVEVGISRQRPEKMATLEARLPYIVPPVTRIISSTLKLFGNPIKVCVSISMMAADTGAVPIDKPVIAVAGTHSGSDTAIVTTPSTTNRILDMKIHEILVKTL